MRVSECWMLELENAPSARDQRYVNTTIVDIEDGERRWDFYERVRDIRRGKAPSWEYYKWLGGDEKDLYLHGEYILQPRAEDCRYHVVEHVHPSWDAPVEYGFVVSMGICEDDRPEYNRLRESVLLSFEERAVDPP